jgi:hypothetical protein
MEEGSRVRDHRPGLFLYTGEASEFRFFQSEVRAGDEAGGILPNANELEESARLQIEIPPPAGHQAARKSPSASKPASPNSATSNSISCTQPPAKAGSWNSMCAYSSSKLLSTRK